MFHCQRSVVNGDHRIVSLNQFFLRLSNRPIVTFSNSKLFLKIRLILFESIEELLLLKNALTQYCFDGQIVEEIVLSYTISLENNLCEIIVTKKYMLLTCTVHCKDSLYQKILQKH